MTDPFSFCVCTYNSAGTLKQCLESIRELSPDSRLIVVDHESQDETQHISRMFSAEVHQESKGLGYARQLCFDLVYTKYIVFVDSDVQVIRGDVLNIITKILETENFGAVVGISVGHRFAYGLPASFLALRKVDFRGKIIPDYIDARETFFIQQRLNTLGRRTLYVPNAIIHRSQFRRFKPEWEGANTRILPSRSIPELVSALGVIIRMSINSRNAKSIAYVPVFYLKFLIGFTNPTPWRRLKR